MAPHCATPQSDRANHYGDRRVKPWSPPGPYAAAAAVKGAGDDAGDQQHHGDDEEPFQSLDEEADTAEDERQYQQQSDESHLSSYPLPTTKWSSALVVG